MVAGIERRSDPSGQLPRRVVATLASITYQPANKSLREPPDEPLAEVEIDPTPIWPAEDGRLEPIFLAGLPWVEFEEFEAVGATPLPVESDWFAQLDAERSEEEPDEPSAAPRQRASAISLLGSLGVHLPTLLVLMLWSSVPAEIPGAIPVQLVVEESPAAPDEVQADRSLPESTSETAPSDDAAVSPPAAPPSQPQVADATRPPTPNPPP